MAANTENKDERLAFQNAMLNGFTMPDGRPRNGFRNDDGTPFLTTIFEGHPKPTKSDKAYAVFVIRPASTFSAEIGPVMRRTVGVVYLQVFLPENTGTKLADDAADVFNESFDLATIAVPTGAIVLGTGTKNPIGTAPNGMLQINITNTYRRDVFRPEPA